MNKQVKIYTDHTERFYEMVSEEDLIQSAADPLMKLLREEVQSEINSEVIKAVYGAP